MGLYRTFVDLRALLGSLEMKYTLLLFLALILPVSLVAQGAANDTEPKASLRLEDKCSEQILMLRYCDPVTDDLLTPAEREVLEGDCRIYNCAGRFVAACQDQAGDRISCPVLHLF